MHDMSEPMANTLACALSSLLWVAVCVSFGGCIAHPEISGKAVVTRDGEELVIDTGGNGTRVVDASGEVAGGCVVRNKGELSVVVQREGAAFSFFDMMDQAGSPHVSVEIDGKLYQGACEITIEDLQDDPYEADVSAGPCDIIRLFDGAKARLETAVFHVSDCSGAD
ncbi:hypothetical protein predicted by Glimmer/Critica [Sorangium cellulosum So ce56]|uniref:Uncharacterized protein n=1 Tax=Sorangium cellulosum (strain So ce56) TaxID=448385 RepID=A9GU58_SORC5|nr:hypothetical protein [Sorangium cellulosum]CAN97039.1 hypothetical protein predicted by Glimmer/Critica [Sorangium cellulosum So ce56]